MNIVVDIRPLMEGKLSGIEVYLVHLLRELFNIDRENTYILFANAAKDITAKIPVFTGPNISVIQTKIPNKLLNLGLSFFRYPKLDKLILNYLKKNPGKVPDTMTDKKIDLFFMPDLRPCVLSKKVKKITVIHDLSFHHFKEFFSQKTRLWYKLLNPKREIKNSDRLIAVSSFTKNDLMETYKIPGHKITVIHEGIAESFGSTNEKTFKHLQHRYDLPEKYFLFLSTIEPRKNVGNMVQAFLIYKKTHLHDPTKLVISGSKNPKIFSQVMLDDHPDIVFTGFIDEDDKAAVMKHAEAFLYPSFFEGFGLPLLEAMKCGTPIITSNTSSMPEVVGNAALLINPHYPDEMAGAMEKIREPHIRNELKKNMEEQVLKFNWKKCAEETLDVFKTI